MACGLIMLIEARFSIAHSLGRGYVHGFVFKLTFNNLRVNYRVKMDLCYVIVYMVYPRNSKYALAKISK